MKCHRMVSMEHVNPFQRPWEETPSGAEPIEKAKGRCLQRWNSSVPFLSSIWLKAPLYGSALPLSDGISLLTQRYPAPHHTPCSRCCTWGERHRACHRASSASQPALLGTSGCWFASGSSSGLLWLFDSLRSRSKSWQDRTLEDRPGLRRAVRQLVVVHCGPAALPAGLQALRR